MVILKSISMARYTNKNVVSFEIQILTKIRQNEIKSTILTLGTEIIASKCLERQKEGINGYIKGK